MIVEPVPFQVPLPGRDTIGLDGIRSTTWRLHGLLHLDADVLVFEWSTVRHSERVSLTSVTVKDDVTPAELLDVPVAWIADAELRGAWWRPRLVLRGRRLDAFDGIPGAGPGTVSLPVRRRDRAIAAAMAAALADLRRLGSPSDRPVLPAGT